MFTFVSNVEFNDEMVEHRTQELMKREMELYGKFIPYEIAKRDSVEYARIEKQGKIYRNETFTVVVYKGESADDVIHDSNLKGKCVLLSISRHDDSTDIRWKDKLEVIREFLGDDWMGIEIYPPEKFMVDSGNRYHVICLPPEYNNDFPFGWKHREINITV